MQLKEKNGIACDLCGTTYKEDFNYYSWDFRLADSNDTRRIIFSNNIISSVDVCTKCNADYMELIVENNKKLSRNIKKCEITNANIALDYYYVVSNGIKVVMSNIPYTCTNCKTQFTGSKCPQCASTEFIKIADVNVTHNVVEFIMCVDAYNGIKQKIETTRRAAGEWATRT